MADLPSRRDLFEIGAEVIRERATRIDPSQIETDGSDVNIMLASESAMAEEVIRQLALAEGRLILDLADGEDLDRYAWDRYQITRKGASAARGSVEMQRTSLGGGGGTIATGQLLRTETGIQYKTLAPATFSASELGPVEVDVEAVEAGKETQVTELTINAFVGEIFDPTITVTNPDPTAGGEPRESAPLFRERIRDAFKNARRGTLGAIEQGALAVPGVVSSSALEVVDSSGIPQRLVELFIADSSGVASAALATLVRDSLEEYRAGGIYVLVNTSAPVYVDIRLALVFQAGVNTTSLTYQIRNAVLAYVNDLGTQKTLFVGGLFSVLERFKPSGLIADEDSIVEPVGDLVPSTGTTIRTTLDRVTVE